MLRLSTECPATIDFRIFSMVKDFLGELCPSTTWYGIGNEEIEPFFPIPLGAIVLPVVMDIHEKQAGDMAREEMSDGGDYSTIYKDSGVMDDLIDLTDEYLQSLNEGYADPDIMEHILLSLAHLKISYIVNSSNVVNPWEGGECDSCYIVNSPQVHVFKEVLDKHDEEDELMRYLGSGNEIEPFMHAVDSFANKLIVQSSYHMGMSFNWDWIISNA